MKINFTYVRYTCEKCGEEYTEPINYVIYSMDYVGYHVERNLKSCKTCYNLSVKATAIKAFFDDEVEFDVMEEKEVNETGERVLLPVLLTWVCNKCSYSWDTTEKFSSAHTRRTRLPFIEADKSCPSCKDKNVKLFMEKDL